MSGPTLGTSVRPALKVERSKWSVRGVGRKGPEVRRGGGAWLLARSLARLARFIAVGMAQTRTAWRVGPLYCEFFPV